MKGIAMATSAPTISVVPLPKFNGGGRQKRAGHSSTFNDLLQLLSDTHEQEVAELRRDLALQEMLSRCRSSGSGAQACEDQDLRGSASAKHGEDQATSLDNEHVTEITKSPRGRLLPSAVRNIRCPTEVYTAVSMVPHDQEVKTDMSQDNSTHVNSRQSTAPLDAHSAFAGRSDRGLDRCGTIETYESDHVEVGSHDRGPHGAWERMTHAVLEQISQKNFACHDFWLTEQSRQTVRSVRSEISSVTALKSITKSYFLKRLMLDSFFEEPEREDDVIKSIGSTSRWYMKPLHPHSKIRVAWVVASLIVLAYDLTLVPIVEAFTLEDDAFVACSMVAQIFWTFDVGVTFVTGIFAHGRLEVRYFYIARAYLRSWFWFDICLVLPQWIMLLLGGDQPVGVFRAFKYLRVARTARLVKLSTLIDHALVGINSVIWRMGVQIAMLIFCFVCLTHLGSCLWFAIGEAQTDGWPAQRSMAGYSSSFSAQYSHALHWALTQFQGTSDVQLGKSLAERMFAVGYVVVAIFVYAAFVSTLTNMLLQVHDCHRRSTREMQMVCQYLSEHNVSMDLSLRVKKYMTWKLRLSEVQAHSDAIAALLPRHLVQMLEVEVGKPMLTKHTFFAVVWSLYERICKRICHSSLHSLMPLAKEMIYGMGERCSHMYFVREGQMMITIYRGIFHAIKEMQIRRVSDRSSIQGRNFDCVTNPIRMKLSQEMPKDSWLCEAVLWTPWVYRCDFFALSDSVVVSLDHNDFMEAVALLPPAHRNIKSYAELFVCALNAYGDDVSDCFDTLSVRMFAQGLLHEEGGRESKRSSSWWNLSNAGYRVSLAKGNRISHT